MCLINAYVEMFCDKGTLICLFPELNCDNDTMSLVLPISSMVDLPLDDLKLNDLSCNVSHNASHVTASFPLNSCGTKIVVNKSYCTNILCRDLRKYLRITYIGC